MVTQEQLKELLHYEINTGVFTRIKGRQGRSAGTKVGHTDREGYQVIEICGVKYKAHRLAWLYVTGMWPEHGIDHEDGNRGNNRFSNLRDATQVLNMQNQKVATKGSSSGLLGVRPSSQGGKWRATIVCSGKHVHLGLFSTPEEAHQAYLAAKRKLHKFNTL